MKELPTTEKILLHKAGLRATTQRLSLLRALGRAKNPISVEQLTKDSRASLDLATTYRTLDTFVMAGIAKQVVLAQGRALYEIAGVHHHHAVCTQCDLIVDVHACLPKGLDKEIQRATKFASINEHSLEFYGVCQPCSRTLK